MSLLIVFVVSFASTGFAQERNVDAQIEAFWAQALTEAEAAVTSSQIAEIESTMAEEEKFYTNLTPETLWEEFIKDNPEVFQLSASEIEYIKQKIKELYNYITPNSTMSTTFEVAPLSTPFTSAIEVYTRGFSREDGLTNLVVLSAIEKNAVNAWAAAPIMYPNNTWQQDAYRHYFWNFAAVQDILVGITQNGSVNSTRIHTTNRELATNILRRNPHLNVANPTASQIATALNLRNNILNSSTFSAWDVFFNSAGGREDLMDLWNNEQGRVDGVSIPDRLLHGAFSKRWNENTVIKSNSTTDVTLSRRQHIFNNRWHRPVR